MKDAATSKNDPIVLMRLAKNGDLDAFGKLYSEYFTPVFRYIYYMTANKEISSDIAQTVFLKVFQALPKYEEKGISPLAYFFTVARTTVIDYWKKKKEISVDFSDEHIIDTVGGASSSYEIHDQIDNKKMADFAMDAIQRLSNDQREILTLKFIQDFSNKEISEFTGKSEAAIRQLQCRALNSLRKILKNE